MNAVELIPIHFRSKDLRFEIRRVETLVGTRWLAIDRSTGRKRNCVSLAEARLHVNAALLLNAPAPVPDDEGDAA